MRNPTGDIQAAKQTSGKFFRIKFHIIFQPCEGNRFFHILLSRLFIIDIKSTKIIHIFIHRKFIKNSDILHYYSDILFDLVSIALHLFPKHLNLSFVIRKQTQNAVNRRRFSGTVRTKKTENLPFFDRQLKMIQCDQFFISFYQIFYFYNCFHRFPLPFV